MKQGLDAYDASQGAVVDWVPLALFARDPENNIIAGLTGSTYWGYLYVGRLWTDQRLRQTGLDSHLLERAEQKARRRGCHAAHLMTGDFNALPFYLKRGYVVFSELNLHVFPQHIPSYLSLAKFYRQKGQLAQAEAALRQALTIQPDRADVLEMLSKIGA